MKTIKTTFLSLACLLLCGMAFGQQGFHKAGIGAEGALPLGDFGEVYGIGFGATGKAYYGITEQGDITGTLGYLQFGIKDGGEFLKGHLSMVPIMFGYQHRFSDGWYGEPQVGLQVVKSSIKLANTGDFDFGNYGGSSSTTELSVGLGGGYDFGVLDVSARFQLVNHSNFIGVRLAYNFSL